MLPEDHGNGYRQSEKGFVKNHASQPTAAEMLQAFNNNPAKWVEQHLVFR